MSVTAQTPYNGYTANGVTTVFPYGFLLLDTDDLVVTVDGVVKTLTTDYTVSGLSNPSGGNVTFLAAPANGAKVLLSRLLTIQRLTDYQDNGDLYAETVNNDFDRIWLALQQLQQNDIRALKLPYDTATDQVIAQDAAARVGKLVSFDASGNMILAVPADLSLQTVSSFIATLLDDANAAAARTTLGLVIGTDVQAFAAAASQAEMEAGTEANLRTMSPLRVRQAIAAALTPPVRQTVLSGPVDTSGFAAFGGSTGSTTVTASGTLKATAAAGGDANYTGSITNPSWTGLSTNGTMYLYLGITSAGVVTTGSTTLAPTYRWGGADVTTNNQNTFNIQEMTMKVGNGSVATQVYRVFVGEVTVAGGVVTAIIWYALMGRYDSGFTATLPAASTQTSKNSYLGIKPLSVDLVFECTSTDGGYAVGDQLHQGGVWNYDGSLQRAVPIGATDNTIWFTSSGSATPWATVNKSSGSGVTLTNANWKYKLLANRGW